MADLPILEKLLCDDHEFSSWHANDLAPFIANEAKKIFVIGKPATGFILFTQIIDEAEIILIWVSPKFRGQSLASKLIEHLTCDCRAKGVCTINLEVAQDNQNAIKLYKSAGFLQTGMRKGYYTRDNGDVIDAINMQLMIN